VIIRFRNGARTASIAAAIGSPLPLSSTRSARHSRKTGSGIARPIPSCGLNTSSATYHFTGGKWYGHTQRGTYVCTTEADKNGEHPQ